MIALPDKDLQKVIDSLVNSIKKTVTESGFNSTVLGLSGGLDSALVAALSAHALGKENVTGIIMPYKFSSKESVDDAFKMAHHLGINHELIDITPAVDTIAQNNMKNINYLTDGRLGNVMARVRMITLFDYSTVNKALVLGTSNKSEIEIGYFTLFGDYASAINPIGSLYKTEVFAISKLIGIPEEIVSKPPTADLFKGQTDESDIGFSYAEMDPVIYAITDLKMSPDEITALGHDEKLVKELNRRITSMSFKRKLPQILKYE
ncbi:MAG: NAD+ synthase [bacterium]